MDSFHRDQLGSWCRSLVIKIGSAVLSDGKEFDHRSLCAIVDGVFALRDSGIDVTVVCSGAVALGMAKLSISSRPTSIELLQAVASVGQVELATRWQQELSRHGLTCAQVLLTHDDVKNRQRFIAARKTLRALLELQVVPLINENDAVAVEEIKMGDNDLLSSLVVSLVGAQHLIILSNIDGLQAFDADGRSTRIEHVDRIDEEILKLVQSAKSNVGSGGMSTKLEAVRRVNELGVSAQIVCGKHEKILENCLAGGDIGTWFSPYQSKLNSRRHWIAYALEVKGQLIIDDGARNALVYEGRSLLPIGLVESRGTYHEGDLVECLTLDGTLIGRGLVGVDSTTIDFMIGKRLEEIEKTLGWSTEIIHRDDLVLSGS